jgi:hypothetical protein
VEHKAIMNLTLEVPDDLARTLEGIAAHQRISVQQLALDRLRELVVPHDARQPGSAAALLRVMNEGPIPSSADVDELDAAIAAGRLPVRSVDLF